MRKIQILLSLFLPLGLDQLSKILVVKFTSISFDINSGFALGILGGSQVIGSIGNSLFIGLLLFILLRYKRAIYYQGLLLSILGASLSNFIDRIIRGGVIDFIPIINLSRTNLADIIIITGLELIIIRSSFFTYRSGTTQNMKHLAGAGLQPVSKH